MPCHDLADRSSFYTFAGMELVLGRTIVSGTFSVAKLRVRSERNPWAADPFSIPSLIPSGATRSYRLQHGGRGARPPAV